MFAFFTPLSPTLEPACALVGSLRLLPSCVSLLEEIESQAREALSFRQSLVTFALALRAQAAGSMSVSTDLFSPVPPCPRAEPRALSRVTTMSHACPYFSLLVPESLLL